MSLQYFFRKDDQYPRAFRWEKKKKTLYKKDLLEFFNFPDVCFCTELSNFNLVSIVYYVNPT